MTLYPKSLFPRIYNPDLSRPILVILLMWLMVNGLLLFKNGVISNGEAAKYIDQANLLVRTGHLGSSKFWLYFIQILLLSLCLKLNLSFGFAVFIQLLFNLAATLYFFKTILFLFNATITAFAGTALLLMNLPYQSFNTFLQTESLFQSFSLLLSCYIIRRQKHSFTEISVISLSLIVLSLTRPTGLLYWPAAFFYYIFSAFKKAPSIKKSSFLTISALLFLYILNRAMGSGGEFDFILPLREEHIICGSPTLLYPKGRNISPDSSPMYALSHYIIHHFGQFTRLAALKSWSFWGLYRSFYSLRHNLYLMIFFYPISLMSLYAVFYRWNNYHYQLIYLLSTIFLVWLTVILSCDDWSNRFYLSISPYIILLSAPVLGKLLQPCLRKELR